MFDSLPEDEAEKQKMFEDICKYIAKLVKPLFDVASIQQTAEGDNENVENLHYDDDDSHSLGDTILHWNDGINALLRGIVGRLWEWVWYFLRIQIHSVYNIDTSELNFLAELTIGQKVTLLFMKTMKCIKLWISELYEVEEINDFVVTYSC